MKRGQQRAAGLLAATLLLASCASLPEVDRLSSTLTPAPPAVANAGPLTPATRAQLARRWRPAGDQRRLNALEEAATGVPLIGGNQVTLLFDGPQTMAAMLQAINGARNNINLETYIFDQDTMGMTFADALIAKQRAGVTVNVMYDSVGTIGVPQAFFERMRAAGIHQIGRAHV